MLNKILSVDFETTCDADLKKVGASKYSKDPSLIVTVAAWAFDSEPVRSVVNTGTGRLVLPEDVVDHLRSGGMLHAWNASFECAILRNHFGVDLRPDQVSCTMQRSLFAGLPGALGDCGPALRLPIVKDTSAHRLMMQMARPRVHRDGRVSYWHIDDPDKLARLRAYCEKDVEAEREIARHIPQLPEREKRISALDRKANERGILLDTRLIRTMMRIADEATQEINARCTAITKGAVTSPGTQTAKMAAWLGSRGLTVDSLAKGYVEDALNRTKVLAAGPEGKAEKAKRVAKALVWRRDEDSSWPVLEAFKTPPFADVTEALQLRQLAAKSSVKKLQAMLNCCEEDQCVRGVLAYYGASRTGRWVGRQIQPQNLPRPSFKDVDGAINFMLDGGDARGLGVFFAPPLEAVSAALRGCLVPREGKAYFTPDLSQIEARLIAYLAGQNDILEVFARGDDVYTHTANKVGLNSRQEGKVAVLGLGYGMGPNKFIETAEGYGLSYSPQRAEEIVSDWRAANPKIVQFWWDCDRAVKDCIRAARSSVFKKATRPINDFVTVEIGPARNGSPLMTMLLPSGRRLYYRDIALEIDDPKREIEMAWRSYHNEEIDAAELKDMLREIELRPRRESITYSGVHQMTKRWSRIRTYSGKIAENLTQAVARDVICDMALEIEERGLGDLVLSVHDELIYELPIKDAEARKDEILKIMCRPPKWAPGLPVKAEGELKSRYAK